MSYAINDEVVKGILDDLRVVSNALGEAMHLDLDNEVAPLLQKASARLYSARKRLAEVTQKERRKTLGGGEE